MEDAFFTSLMDFGVSLLECGAEISRVEDTLKRIGSAHGCMGMQVFVITSCIIVTLTSPEGETKTQIRRILTPPSTNFGLLEKLNQVSRRYCACPTEDFTALVANIHAPKRKADTIIGAALAAGAFALFFGGSIYDAFAAGAFGILITLLSGHIYAISSNQLIYHLLSSFVSGLGIGLLTRAFPYLHGEMIL
ncbi:MAG: threonine/serine exporter family protein, partial [Blautia sp.]|nr:threonine/serine exporter family protein [Blautia sp.]